MNLKSFKHNKKACQIKETEEEWYNYSLLDFWWAVKEVSRVY